MTQERIDKAVVLPVSDQDRYIIVKALGDYSEWAGEAAADKRVEAERASPSDNGEGLDAEADYLEMEQEAAGRLAREWEAANPADGPVAVLPGGQIESGAKALLALLDAEIEATECKGASAPGISHCAECCFGTGIIATDRDDELYAQAIRHLRYTLDDEGFRLVADEEDE